jgi:hypothetical protein
MCIELQYPTLALRRGRMVTHVTGVVVEFVRGSREKNRRSIDECALWDNNCFGFGWD